MTSDRTVQMFGSTVLIRVEIDNARIVRVRALRGSETCCKLVEATNRQMQAGTDLIAQHHKVQQMADLLGVLLSMQDEARAAAEKRAA